ncbi:MAG: recombinase family protein [Clostridium sp.]
MKKIAIYSRKSKMTGKGESIENQILKCKQFIEFKFEICPDNVEIFIDEGFSGKNENRPQYKQMMTKIQAGEINSIVIYQLNRLGRNARDIHNTMQMCDDLDTIIYSATEGFDSSTSFGRAIIGILASLAQLEREQLAERVKDNMYTLVKMGRWLGGQSPLGFDGVREYYIDEDGKERSITRLKKNNEELKLVKSIYSKYLEEKSLSQVSKWCLSKHLKGKNGGNLDKSTINSILQNPVYVKSSTDVMDYLSKEYEVCGECNGNGLLRYGKINKKDDNGIDNKKIVAVAKHKGVIDSDVWLNVQRTLKTNTEKAPRLGRTHTALLTGILKCNCGSGMRVTYGPKNKSGLRTFYYTCSMKNNSGGTRCNSKNLNGPVVEDKLINYIKLYNRDILIARLNKLMEENKKLNSSLTSKNIDTEIDTCKKAINALLNKLKLIDDDDISKLLLNEIAVEKNKLDNLEKEKEQLLNEQSKLSFCQSDILNFISILENFNETFDDLSLEEKQKQLKILFKKIIYDGYNFDITFNIKKN